MKLKKIEFETDSFKCWVKDNLGILKLKCDGFKNLQNIESDREMLEWLDQTAFDDKISGILFLNSPGCYSDQAYKEFLSEVSGRSIEEIEEHGVTKFENSQTRSIEINMLMNFIRKLVSFPKLTVCGLRGEIVTPFIGLSLACDMRFLEAESTLNFSHIKYAIHPSAALPFFLPYYVGQGKAMEILFTGGVINTTEALKLGMVNDVLNESNFEETVINKSLEVCKLNLQLIKTTKALSNNFKSELDRFLEKESNYMLR